MRPAYLTGVSLWSPGYRDLAAFVAGVEDPTVIDCAAPWVPARLGRGSSRLTRMLGEVAARACEGAAVDPKTVATLYASSYGEIETMVVLLQAIFEGDGQLSPMRFKNSVHNAAGGLGSIGTGNQAFSTALAAAERSLEAGLLEAMALLSERGGEAVVAVADDRLPAPLSAQCAREGLAVGLCLQAARPEGGALAVLDGLRMDRDAVPFTPTFAGRVLDPGRAANPAAAALALIDAVRAGQEAWVPLAFDVPRPWVLRVRPDLVP